MASKALPSPEVLRQLLRYEPETGKLFWRDTRKKGNGFNHGLLSEPALDALHRDGYRQGTVLGSRILAHRVVWAMVNGEWPLNDIDHINGIRSDNRIDNLRAVTRRENAHNTKRRETNTSGHTGVCWFSRNKKWGASIMNDGIREFLGLFNSLDDAVAARKAAEVAHGFHQNHGRAT